MKQEHRRTPRKRLQQFLPVLDAGSQQPLGRLVDISLAGMMMISNEPMETGQDIWLQIQSPEDSGLPALRIQARTVWTRSSSHNQTHHGCGLEFSNLTVEQQTLLQQLIHAKDSTLA